VCTASVALEDEAPRATANASSTRDSSLQRIPAAASSCAWRRRSSGGRLTRRVACIGAKTAHLQERGSPKGLRKGIALANTHARRTYTRAVLACSRIFQAERDASIAERCIFLACPRIYLPSRGGREHRGEMHLLGLPAHHPIARSRLSSARSSFARTATRCQPPVTIDPLAPLILTPLLRPVHSALMLPALTSPALFFCFSL
jgi:hypothetical protein